MTAVGLDTSVVIRLLTGLPEEQAEKAKRYIESLHAENRKALISDLVVAETYFVLIHHYSMPEGEVQALLTALLESGFVAPEPGGSALETLKMAAKTKPGFVARLIRNQYLVYAWEVATFDVDFGKMERVVRLRA